MQACTEAALHQLGRSDIGESLSKVGVRKTHPRSQLLMEAGRKASPKPRAPQDLPPCPLRAGNTLPELQLYFWLSFCAGEAVPNRGR